MCAPPFSPRPRRRPAEGRDSLVGTALQGQLQLAEQRLHEMTDALVAALSVALQSGSGSTAAACGPVIPPPPPPAPRAFLGSGPALDSAIGSRSILMMMELGPRESYVSSGAYDPVDL